MGAGLVRVPSGQLTIVWCHRHWRALGSTNVLRFIKSRCVSLYSYANMTVTRNGRLLTDGYPVATLCQECIFGSGLNKRYALSVDVVEFIKSNVVECPATILYSEDQTDAIAGHTAKGVEFLERIGTFAKERALIEEEYAAKLRTLAKKSLGRKKEDEEASKNFTYVIGERIRKEVIPYVAARAGVHRTQRKQCLSDLQTIHANLTTAMDHLFKAQKHYGKTFKEAEAAFLKYAKADKNMEISRLDLDKAKNNAQMRSNISEEAKHAYAHALQCANDAQSAHYSQLLPEALARMRAIDLERINDTKIAMELCIASEVDVRPIIARCHEDMKKAVDQIDAIQDTAMVVEQFKTGYVYPPPIQFEDLGRPDSCLSIGGDMPHIDVTLKRTVLSGGKKDSKGVSRKQSMHQKFFGGGDKHKASNRTINFSESFEPGSFQYGIFYEPCVEILPPQQRIRRLQAKVAELEKEREKCQQSKEGLVKMKQVYTANPKMGNAADCETQLCQYEKEIESINQQISKFRLLLDDIQLQNNQPIGGSDTPPSVRSASSNSSVPPARPPQPQTSQCGSYSEESVTSNDGCNTSNLNAVNQRRDEVYEECAMPALGTAVAQFPFEGGTEGTIDMRDGEELLLIEKDEGDGWTRVRRIASSVEGFVPTSYLQCKWYTTEDK
uniref:SH3 domain-containing protein n=1 Tax=Angiostrongylus cantonensis TaxID=6313 RepID=A0A158PCJ7_ANGCA